MEKSKFKVYIKLLEKYSGKKVVFEDNQKDVGAIRKSNDKIINDYKNFLTKYQISNESFSEDAYNLFGQPKSKNAGFNFYKKCVLNGSLGSLYDYYYDNIKPKKNTERMDDEKPIWNQF